MYKLTEKENRLLKLAKGLFRKSQLETREKRKVTRYGCRITKSANAYDRAIAQLETLIKNRREDVMLVNCSRVQLASTRKLTPTVYILTKSGNKEYLEVA